MLTLCANKNPPSQVELQTAVLFLVQRRSRVSVSKKKSFTIHDVKEPKEGWDYLERLLRYNVHYRVDMMNFGLVTGVETATQLKRQCIARMKHLADGWAMSYVDIYRIAAGYGMVPEFLVDKVYYQTKSGILAYRMAFSALRKGMDLWDLYVATLAAGWKISPWTFYSLVSGQKKTMHFLDLETVDGICGLAGIELADLFESRSRRIAAASQVFRELSTIMCLLDDVDVAALAGIAAALAKRKDDASTLAEIGEVLKWREGLKCSRLEESAG